MGTSRFRLKNGTLHVLHPSWWRLHHPSWVFFYLNKTSKKKKTENKNGNGVLEKQSSGVQSPEYFAEIPFVLPVCTL